MNILKTWLLFATAIFTALLFTACTDEDSPEGADAIPAELIGTWTLNNDETITFHEDGTGEYVYYEDNGWNALKRPLSTAAAHETRSRYQVTTYFDFSYKIATREITLRADGKKVIWRISTFSDGHISIVDQNGKSIYLVKQGPDTPGQNDEVPALLLGTWTNNNYARLTFREDGTGEYIPGNRTSNRSTTTAATTGEGFLKRAKAQMASGNRRVVATTGEAIPFTYTYNAADNRLVLTGEYASRTLDINELTASFLLVTYEDTQQYSWYKTNGSADANWIVGVWGWAYTPIFNFDENNQLTLLSMGDGTPVHYDYNSGKQLLSVDGYGEFPVPYLSLDMLQIEFAAGNRILLETVFRMTNEPWTVGPFSLLYNKQWYTCFGEGEMTLEFYEGYTGRATGTGDAPYNAPFTYVYDSDAQEVYITDSEETVKWRLLRLTDSRLVFAYTESGGEEEYIEMTVRDNDGY